MTSAISPFENTKPTKVTEAQHKILRAIEAGAVLTSHTWATRRMWALSTEFHHLHGSTLNGLVAKKLIQPVGSRWSMTTWEITEAGRNAFYALPF